MATKDTTATSGGQQLGHRAVRACCRRDHRVGRDGRGPRIGRGRRRYGAACRARRPNDWLDLAARHRKSCGERHPIDDDGRTVGRTHHQARRKQHGDGGKPHGGTCNARGEATSGQIDAHRNANRENKTRPSDRAESVDAEGAAEDVPIEIDAVQEERREERSKPEALLTI